MRLSKHIQQLILLAAGAMAFPAGADNYLGTLKLPGASPNTPNGFYTFSAGSLNGLMPKNLGEGGVRLKLGYKYSRYLSVESEYVDFGTNAGNLFANPANLASGFRGSGFGVDTIATVPLWRQFSFYGRLGAYSGTRELFAPNAVSLLGEGSRSTRVRYGLGLRYDFTKSLGIRAEMERYSPLGSPIAGEPEADLFSVGLMWRF